MERLARIQAEAQDLVEEGRHLLINFGKDEASTDFDSEYQNWYSKSLAVMRVIAGDRIDEFVELYRPSRRAGHDVDIATYGIADWVQGVTLRHHDSRSFVFGKFDTQWRILGSVVQRLESAVSDIEGTIRSSLLDDELDQARLLVKSGYTRAAGVIAGVVLESHLDSVCARHDVKLGRKKKTIGNLKDALRSAEVIDLPVARQIEALADIRNLCGHKSSREPTPEEVERLIDQTDRYTRELW